MPKSFPCVLIVLDGYGLAPEAPSNAVTAARTPILKQIFSNPGSTSTLQAAGEFVGLRKGQIGNSEVGHLHLGAGRICLQGLEYVQSKLQDPDQLVSHPRLQGPLKALATRGGRVHLIGLLSPGGVHSHEDHILSLAKFFTQQGASSILLHGILDGRDCPPKSASGSIQKAQSALACLPRPGQGQFVSIVGRYYGMDRDRRWERTEAAYRLLALAQAPHQAPGALAGLEAAYQRGETDEFCAPTLCDKQYSGLQDGDLVLFCNFRADRAVQLSQALGIQAFSAFPRSMPYATTFLTLTEYDPTLKSFALFPQEELHGTLSEVLAQAKLRQYRLSETEKFAHVTYFFNGNRHQPWPKEVQRLIPSDRSVPTYDLAPGMRASEITAALIEATASKRYSFLLCNYPNADMVGHTGNFPATVRALQSLDDALGQFLQAIDLHSTHLFITADHGNAECMFDEKSQQPHTAHTTNPVPLAYLGPCKKRLRTNGSLIDVAPSILELLGLSQPEVMTGSPLWI